MDYLALPVVLRDGYLDRADLRESITYSVGLLLSSRLGAMRFNPTYGCDIWDREFTDLHSANKADIRASLRNALDKFEKRLKNVSVSFMGLEDDPSHSLGAAVKVSGTIVDGGREETFEASYVLG